jgi:hypothetical protein
LTNTFGLAADQVVEYKIVTADGKFRIANPVSNPDLFWALRGGGGGTFGVVIEATMKVRYNQVLQISLSGLTISSGFPYTKNHADQVVDKNENTRRP